MPKSKRGRADIATNASRMHFIGNQMFELLIYSGYTERTCIKYMASFFRSIVFYLH